MKYIEIIKYTCSKERWSLILNTLFYIFMEKNKVEIIKLLRLKKASQNSTLLKTSSLTSLYKESLRRKIIQNISNTIRRSRGSSIVVVFDEVKTCENCNSLEFYLQRLTTAVVVVVFELLIRLMDPKPHLRNYLQTECCCYCWRIEPVRHY